MSPRPATTLTERPEPAAMAAGTRIRDSRATKAAPSVRGRRVAQAQDSGTTLRDRARGAADAARKVPFAAVVVAMLVAGIGFTLFLSARSTEDTYALRSAQQQNAQLAEARDQLLTDIEGERSAEALARKAHDLGMVSVISAPIIVRNPDGSTRVVGDEEAKLGDPVSPLQSAATPPPAAPQHGADAATRFGLPGAERATPPTANGGLSVPYPNGSSPVPDLGAGRRVDTPAAPVAPVPPTYPTGPADGLPGPAPVDSPPHLAPAAPPAE